MKGEKDKEKRYVVRKYIFAKSAIDAIKKDKDFPVDDVWVDEKWDEKIQVIEGIKCA